jgi:hypothetical protein
MFIHSFILSSMAVQLFSKPWPIFHFLNPVHIWRDSLERGSARRKASFYTPESTNIE